MERAPDTPSSCRKWLVLITVTVIVAFSGVATEVTPPMAASGRLGRLLALMKGDASFIIGSGPVLRIAREADLTRFQDERRPWRADETRPSESQLSITDRRER